MLKSKIETLYEKHNCSRLCQGDILKDYVINVVNSDKSVSELSFPYIIVLSQDCDLHQMLTEPPKKEGATKPQEIPETDNPINNQFLPNIIFIPAFVADFVKEGTHLSKIYNIMQRNIGSEQLNNIKKNKNDRYHYLPSHQVLGIPELVVDFKIYFTLRLEETITNYKSFYIATINELFRETLSQRYSYYLSRIGLPEINYAAQAPAVTANVIQDK